jgi:hypothetical protein
MGLILKIALLGLAIYAAYKTFARWKGLYDKFVGKPDPAEQRQAPPPPPTPPPAPAAPQKKIVAEDAQTCSVCGAFFAAGATKCGQPNCPLPGAAA